MMSFYDIVASRVLMGLVLFEFFADQQQWGKSPREMISHKAN